MASTILAASVGSKPWIPIAPQQNAIDFTLQARPSVNNCYKNLSAYSHFIIYFIIIFIIFGKL